MAEIEIALDTLPDKDSFLPRYLTVQLLEILANTINQDAILTNSNYQIRNPNFVESFKKEKDLFTPLTYSIFWRDNIEQALAENTLSLDATDKYSRAPLTLAIANEDFALATKLFKSGAALLMEDKLVFEIVLISMLQRDPNLLQQILQSRAGQESSWIKEYLEYLLSYAQGAPKKPSHLPYHEVLNPPLRQFGQMLDTLVYFNGLPSHYGFLSPSIELLAKHLKQYLIEITDDTAKRLFSLISDAFEATLQLCKFYGNAPTNKEAASILAQKISANFNAKNSIPIVIFGGFAGNSIAISFINNILIYSNLGVGGNPETGTQFFTIKNISKIDDKMIDMILCGLNNATPPYVILDSLGDIIEHKPIYKLKQIFNPIDNCIFVNPRAIIEGMLLVLGVIHTDGKITAGNLASSANTFSEYYISYLNSLYQNSTANLAEFMRNSKLLQNRRIECCALALDYINQHYNDPNALMRCIELKNALEFVGLKDFYQYNINQNAKDAIQKIIISEQEATAEKVIIKENEMLAQDRNKDSTN